MLLMKYINNLHKNQCPSRNLKISHYPNFGNLSSWPATKIRNMRSDVLFFVFNWCYCILFKQFWRCLRCVCLVCWLFIRVHLISLYITIYNKSTRFIDYSVFLIVGVQSLCHLPLIFHFNIYNKVITISLYFLH